MKPILILVVSIIVWGCKKEDKTTSTIDNYPNISSIFNGSIDLTKLENYANQAIPSYITKDNTNTNFISDKGATLGRVLFYDKNLSADNTISCASCHHQQFGFSDTALASVGVNGITGRHSMRLINARFSTETKFFWDERASTLEIQASMPIKDHGEMGFSGTDGDPTFDELIAKLSKLSYYQELFQFVYGTPEITEQKIQNALAQFVRSIQSFDSKYDVGRSQVTADNINFPNFTAQENQGKLLFLSPPQFNANSQRIGGGLGCGGCHRAPEFDIDPNTGNNGIIGILNGNGFDLTNTKAPSLRNLTNNSGIPNGPMMHTGVISTLQAAIGHYGTINANAANTNLDPRLKPNNIGQQLQLTATEVNAVIAFLKTLSGTDVYSNKKWSNPFPE